MKYILVLFISLISTTGNSQKGIFNNIGVYGGYSHTVTNDYIGSSKTKFNKLNQSVISEPLNSPNYLSTWHLGFNKSMLVSKHFEFITGFRYVNRGNNDKGTTSIPVMSTLPEIGGYLGVPILISYRLIENNEYAIVIGLTNYLRIYRKKYPEIFLDPLVSAPLHLVELDLEISIPVNQQVYLYLRYSNGLKPWKKPSVSINPDIDIVSKEILHSFEISIGYEIN